VSFNLVGVENLRHVGNLNQRLTRVCHESFASIP
jgi:hypothetical protein